MDLLPCLGQLSRLREKASVYYVISTPNMFNFVSHFVLHEPNILSDHCNIDFDLTFEKRIVADDPLYADCNNSHTSVDCKYVWDNTKVHNFDCKLNSLCLKFVT